MKIFPHGTAGTSVEKTGDVGAHSTKGERDAIYEITGLHYQVETKSTLKPFANRYHIMALLICGTYWGISDVPLVLDLSYGFGIQTICVFLVVIANIFTVAALGELIVLFPQAGGVVGFGRVALGHMFGFICGVMECIDLATSTALGSLFFSGYIQDTFNTDPAILVLWSFLIYVVSFAIIYSGGRTPWNFMMVSAAAVTVVVFLAFLAAMIHGDFLVNAFQYNLGTDDPVNGHTPPAPANSRVVFLAGVEPWVIVLPASFWLCVDFYFAPLFFSHECFIVWLGLKCSESLEGKSST